MHSTKFKVEDIFDVAISTDTISHEQITKPNIFLAKMM